MEKLLDAIVNDDSPTVRTLLQAEPSLVRVMADDARFYDGKIFHWLYAGDTALHLAAAGYRDEIAKLLLSSGTDPNSQRNHRRATPLHYAADGYVNGSAWDPNKQVKTIGVLIKAGADIHARDKNGATPLHRAVRTRCAAAVKCLLDAGAGQNNSGSTAFHLAVQCTGRGGSGAPVAKAAQQEIIQEFLVRGIDPETLANSKGKSVFDSAKSPWIRDLLREGGK